MQMPANSLFVDTSGWADPILRNTTHHDEMERYYREMIANQRPLVTTNYVLAETVALLASQSRASRKQVLDILNRIRHMPQLRIIHVDEMTDEAAWAMLNQFADKDWSVVDAASFIVMRRLGIQEAFTSDGHFSQAGLIRVPR